MLMMPVQMSLQWGQRGYPVRLIALTVAVFARSSVAPLPPGHLFNTPYGRSVNLHTRGGSSSERLKRLIVFTVLIQSFRKANVAEGSRRMELS